MAVFFNLRINFYLLRTFCPHLGSPLCCFFHDVSAKFYLWPSSGDLPRPRTGMLSLITVSPVITAFHSCCLSHHVFDQVNLWPAWVGFETAIFWQCSPGTVETQRPYPLRHGPRPWYDRQQLWKAVITGDTVTRLSILIRGRVNHLAETSWKKQHKGLPRWGQKVRNK